MLELHIVERKFRNCGLPKVAGEWNSRVSIGQTEDGWRTCTLSMILKKCIVTWGCGATHFINASSGLLLVLRQSSYLRDLFTFCCVFDFHFDTSRFPGVSKEAVRCSFFILFECHKMCMFSESNLTLLIKSWSLKSNVRLQFVYLHSNFGIFYSYYFFVQLLLDKSQNFFCSWCSFYWIVSLFLALSRVSWLWFQSVLEVSWPRQGEV